jgi:hypothetical protein
MPEVTSPSISEAWRQAVTLALATAKREIFVFTVTVTDLASGVPQEDPRVRNSLDLSLQANGHACIETVAATIFPRSLWNPAKPRKVLFDRYNHIFSRIKQHPKNRRGTYFQRMIAYPNLEEEPFNQLDQVIGTYVGGNHRRSALQASVIVPRLDLNDARQLGFPCMHQVAFLPDGERRKLHVIGFYPMQYLYERAYGNYLGLIRLGHFMAQEMGLELEAMSCVSVVTKLEVSRQIIEGLV